MGNKIESHTKSIGEVLASTNSLFAVPSYQRDYSWEREQVQQLWKDIIDNIKNHRSEEYFMGAIVINNSQQPEELIDGQQRLATISLLMCVIRDISKKYGKDKYSQKISDLYLGSSKFITMEKEEIEPKLTLNEADNNFFRDNFIEPKEISFLKGLVKPNKKRLDSKQLLLDAYIFLYTEIEKAYTESSNILTHLTQIENPEI